MKKLCCFFAVLTLCCLFAAGCSEPGKQTVTEDSEKVQEADEEGKEKTDAFHGLTPGGDTPKLGFQSVNNRSGSGENYVCVDSDTGEVYYVNAGKDNYLYCLDGNKKKLVLKKFVDCINVLDGVLYFRYGKNPQYDWKQRNSYRGKAYSYDLKTKKMTCLTEDEIAWLAVSEEGLYCHFGFDSSEYKNTIYFSAFGTDTWEPLFEDGTGIWLEIYKNYMLKMVADKEENYQLIWVDQKNGEEVELLGKGEYPFDGFLYQDYYYVSIDEKETRCVYRIDLNDGKRYRYWARKVDLGGGHIAGDGYKMNVTSLVELNGKTYSGSDVYGTIWTGDADGDHVEMKKVSGSNHLYRRLYTDGNRLFAWYNNGMVELVISDDGIREEPIGQ